MNDVGGSESGTGLRAGKTSRTSDTNFEYDDNDWDVGIGNLIIDLDANIAAEKNNEISGSTSAGSPTTISPSPGSTSTSSSSSQMHIPSSTTTTSSNNSTKGKSSSTVHVNAGGKSSSSSTSDSGPSNPVVSVSMDSATDKGLKMKIKRTKPGTKSVDAKHEIVKSDVINAAGTPGAITPLPSGKNSTNSEVKVLTATPNSLKEIKDVKLAEEKASPQTSGSDKGKNQKRTTNTAQKKVKPGPGNPIGPVPVSASTTSSIINKKESPDHKHLPNSSLHSGTTIGPTSAKDPFSNSSSAFAKATTVNATIKSSSQVGTVNLHGGTINTFGTVVSGSPSKSEKLHPSTPLPNTNIDKSISGSLTKKPKPGSTDKNQIMQHEDLSSSTVANAFRTGMNMELDTPTQNTLPIKGNKNPLNNSQDACVGTSVGTITEPDCLGPCEPGSAVTLEGIVWHETESGVLVVNVTWRGKTYVGTLLDCTKNDWASPRFCDSPTSDLEMRTPKNRGKRGRAQTATPVSDPTTTDTKLRNGQKGRRGSSSNAFVAPVSPMKPEQWPKRKTRGSENEPHEEQTTKTSKRLKLTKESGGRNSNSPALEGSGPYSPQLIECPEPNCSKKYKHINGLRYHQSHAHSNNFAPEDSDSNMSTASTTNVNTPVEASGAANDEVLGDLAVDMDTAEANQSGTETNSAPSTPVKKTKDAEKVPEVAESDIKPLIKSSEVESLQLGNKLIPTKAKISKDKDESEKDLEIKEGTPPTSSVSRTHILNVPTLMSMANRSPLQTHSISSQRGAQEAGDSNTTLTKVGASGTPGNLTTNVPKSNSGGVPWQPHANSSSSSQSQSSHVISSLNIPVPLTVPMSSLSSKESDKSTKELKPTANSGAESPSKKQKHKKRSKERPDRDRDRDNIGKPESGNKDHFRGNYPPPGSASIIGKGKDERRSSSEFKDISRRDSEGGSGTIENPQSPAYSDISDANDSAPETEINPNENTTKTIPVSEIKKEGTGAPGMPTFFSPFYSPHSLENPYSNSNSPGNSGQVKPERGSIPGSSAEDQNSDKSKSKHPQHPEDRRSPNVDYRSKYLPPQQSFYPYPYSNYHFEQQPFGLMPENSFPPGRGLLEEKEREMEESRRFGKGKPGSESERGDTGSGPNLNAFNIKQEPVERSGHKEHRVHGVMEEKSSGHTTDSKSDFGNDFPEMKRHSQSTTPHFASSSGKHSKDFRREDRHSSKDSDGKDHLKRTSSDHTSRHKSSDSSSSIDKDVKNEGVKPTMETTGPPPPPTTGYAAYHLPPGYLQGNPFGLPFDPNHHLYRQVMVPNPFPGSPYMHPSAMSRFPGPPGATPLPEDLSRPSAGSSKGLDLLQHAASQYYASHKIHELQERALKSPSPQVNSSSSGGGISGPTPPSTTPASPQPRGGNLSGSTSDRKPTDLSKDPKTTSASQSSAGPGSESSRSPPIHHVHTHMHSHTHIGYPIIPTVPPQYSPHYGVLTTPPATPATVIPPFTSQKPT